MNSLYFFLSIIFITPLFTFVFGITKADIQKLRLARDIQRHPGARRWRVRPAINISQDDLSPKQLASLRKNRYRKLHVNKSVTQPVNALQLSLPTNTLLADNAILSSVHLLASDEQRKAVVMAPALSAATTISQLFTNYYYIAAYPFIASQFGLRVVTAQKQWPTMTRSTLMINRRSILYIIGRWVLQSFNLVTFIYASYLAFILGQSDLILLYAAGFYLWMVWAAILYPSISLAGRIAYIMLLPVSFVYFAHRAIVAPFQGVAALVSIISRRGNVIIKV